MNVSIVIPTLNEEENIRELFEQLAPQVDVGDEVIVVDGGSEDGTIDICKDAGCKVLIAEESSIGEARQIGSEHATKDIIASTDADARPPNGWVNRVKMHFEADRELAVLWGNVKDKNGVPLRNMVGKLSTMARGASGNNTAFRKSAFEELKKGYPDISFLEDVAIIQRLSKIGKAKYDSKLIMVMDMDRRRYQTIPILTTSTVAGLLGKKVGGKVGQMVLGSAIGMAGTEATYESATGSPFHHDQIGAGIATIGSEFVENGDMFKGLGAGMVAHHALTEGVSFMPTTLMENTDEIQ